MSDSQKACNGVGMACDDFNNAWDIARKNDAAHWNGPAMMAELTRHQQVVHGTNDIVVVR